MVAEEEDWLDLALKWKLNLFVYRRFFQILTLKFNKKSARLNRLILSNNNNCLLRLTYISFYDSSFSNDRGAFTLTTTFTDKITISLELWFLTFIDPPKSYSIFKALNKSINLLRIDGSSLEYIQQIFSTKTEIYHLTKIKQQINIKLFGSLPETIRG